MQRRFRLSFLLLLASAAAGCPRIEQEQPAPAGEAPEDAGEPLESLSDGELADVCADLNERMEERFTNRELAAFECTRVYLGSGDRLSCSFAVQECVAETPGSSEAAPRPPEFEIDEDECDAIGSCSVGVNEFDDCIGARFEQTDRLLARMNCDVAGDPELVDERLRELEAPRALPESCVGVQSRCPGLL